MGSNLISVSVFQLTVIACISRRDVEENIVQYFKVYQSKAKVNAKNYCDFFLILILFNKYNGLKYHYLLGENNTIIEKFGAQLPYNE